MKIKTVVITHHGAVEGVTERCGFIRFWANNSGKMRAQILCETDDNESLKLVEYDFKHLIEGITYRQRTQTHETFIEGVRKEGDLLHIDVHDMQNPFTEVTITGLSEEYKMAEILRSYDLITTVNHSAIFPPIETHEEWIDRMERMLAFSAHNFETAMGQLHLQNYTRLHDVMTANPSTDMLVRATNTSVHCRMQIGWCWERVDRLKRKLSSSYTKTMVEEQVMGVYENMKTPQNIKLFFHKHDTVEWNKLRNHGPDKNENKRQVVLWNDTYAAGTILADINARNTIGSTFHETNAEATSFTLGTTQFKKAASNPNYLPITERIY